MDPYIGETRMVGFNFGTLAKLYVINGDTTLQFNLSTLLSGTFPSQMASAALASLGTASTAATW
jgi:hypothetical protein